MSREQGVRRKLLVTWTVERPQRDFFIDIDVFYERLCAKNILTIGLFPQIDSSPRDV
jgi:hypothetical protein